MPLRLHLEDKVYFMRLLRLTGVTFIMTATALSSLTEHP